MKHRFSIIAENKSGVLARILGVISARGMNVETLQVDESAEPGQPPLEPGLAHITLVTDGEETAVERVAQKIGQQVRVLTITREMV